MSAIVFDCNRGCGAPLSADLGTGQDFGPCNTDAEAFEHGRRRREYIGQQVENALLAHLLLACPKVVDDHVCALCATPVDGVDVEVCDTCTSRIPFNVHRPEAGQQ